MPLALLIYAQHDFSNSNDWEPEKINVEGLSVREFANAIGLGGDSNFQFYEFPDDRVKKVAITAPNKYYHMLGVASLWKDERIDAVLEDFRVGISVPEGSIYENGVRSRLQLRQIFNDAGMELDRDQNVSLALFALSAQTAEDFFPAQDYLCKSEKGKDFVSTIGLMVAGINITGLGSGAGSSLTNYGDKSAADLTKRGWTWDSAQNVVNNRHATSPALNKATGNAATAYFNQAGEYIVVDNVTGGLVQASEVGNAGWIPDSTIVNPFKP